MKPFAKLLPVVAIIMGSQGLTISSAHAGIINPVPPANINNPGTCSTSKATLNSVHVSDFDISNNVNDDGKSGANLLANGPYVASECIGVFGFNDGNLHPTGNNIGELGDGLLNGGDFKIKGSPNSLAELPFITNADLQDLDGDGTATDPGWIHLGKFEGGSSANITDYSHIAPNNNTGTHIADLLRIDFQCLDDGDGDGQPDSNQVGESVINGCSSVSWSLKTDIDIIPQVQAILGKSTFDHLAISVKAGSGSSDSGFAVYDFNFKTIFGNEAPGAFDFNTPYILGGTINTADLGGRDISHITFWARDPQDTTTTRIPEPSSIFLLSVALIALYRRKIKAL